MHTESEEKKPARLFLLVTGGVAASLHLTSPLSFPRPSPSAFVCHFATISFTDHLTLTLFGHSEKLSTSHALQNH